MNFFLQIKDGQPEGHPIDEASVRTLYNGVIPGSYGPFVPAGPPVDLGPYETCDASPSYVQRGQSWTHDYNRREMTDDEKAALIAEVQQQWQATGYASWIWNEAECRYMPPVQPPTDTGAYHWDEASQQWLEGPMPLD